MTDDAPGVVTDTFYAAMLTAISSNDFQSAQTLVDFDNARRSESEQLLQLSDWEENFHSEIVKQRTAFQEHTHRQDELHAYLHTQGTSGVFATATHPIAVGGPQSAAQPQSKRGPQSVAQPRSYRETVHITDWELNPSLDLSVKACFKETPYDWTAFRALVAQRELDPVTLIDRFAAWDTRQKLLSHCSQYQTAVHASPVDMRPRLTRAAVHQFDALWAKLDTIALVDFVEQSEIDVSMWFVISARQQLDPTMTRAKDPKFIAEIDAAVVEPLAKYYATLAVHNGEFNDQAAAQVPSMLRAKSESAVAAWRA
jgi:hypothetical protein